MANKIYIVKKYILAKNAEDALKIKPDDVYAEETCHREHLNELTKSNLGFKKK